MNYVMKANYPIHCWQPIQTKQILVIIIIFSKYLGKYFIFYSVLNVIFNKNDENPLLTGTSF